ncbi:MAG: energy-coupling factor ABC transporter ATP-binding protein [Candidatus Limnocylindrales bacterium]
MTDVGYGYAGATATVLEGITLEVRRGQVLGVVGPNDAGKSTLCLVAAGLAPGSIGGRLVGSVTLDGRETRDLRPFEAAQRCGILFQNPTTQGSGTASTVFEEIAFGPRNLGLDLPEIVDRVDQVVATLDLGLLLPRDPHRLSGGESQLVALASVMAMRPAVLVLDEPTSQLDPAGTRLVGDAIRRLAEDAGTAILITEHKTGLLARLADDVALLDGRRIVAMGRATDLLGDPGLEAHGVRPPESVSLLRAIESAGLRDPVAASGWNGLGE